MWHKMNKAKWRKCQEWKWSAMKRMKKVRAVGPDDIPVEV